MRAVVIGLGSMGKRRIRLLMENKNIQVVGVDSQETRCREVYGKYEVNCYASLDETLKLGRIDCAFVCTSPLSHSEIIRTCLTHGLHVFTEINLVNDGYDSNMKLAERNGLVLFLSSTFLHRKETMTIIEKVRNSDYRLNYIYHVGQYLPDWHPWEGYNNYFIGNPKTNGCREIMAIDLPWIVTCFGDIKGINVLKGKNTDLNISYNDNYLVLMEHESGVRGVFAVDVVSRKPYRHIEIYGENLQISWNGTPESLMQYDIEKKCMERIDLSDASEHVDGYAEFITESPYREEIRAFLKQISDNTYAPVWNFSKDKKILDWIDKIEA